MVWGVYNHINLLIKLVLKHRLDLTSPALLRGPTILTMIQEEIIMSKIYTSADQLIGKTPLLELAHLEKEENLEARILGKL